MGARKKNQLKGAVTRRVYKRKRTNEDKNYTTITMSTRVYIHIRARRSKQRAAPRDCIPVISDIKYPAKIKYKQDSAEIYSASAQ